MADLKYKNNLNYAEFCCVPTLQGGGEASCAQDITQ